MVLLKEPLGLGVAALRTFRLSVGCEPDWEAEMRMCFDDGGFGHSCSGR